MKFALLAFLGLLVSCSSNQPAKEKMNDLLIYGKGFVFGVKEPDHWVGDTEHASEFSVNVIFYRENQKQISTDGMIRVRLNDKGDENTDSDLVYDMQVFREKYPNIKFQDFPASHAKYRCFPKLFYVEGEFYEYVTYVNPGQGTKFTFSVAMNSWKKEATRDELAAYDSVVASLDYLGK